MSDAVEPKTVIEVAGMIYANAVVGERLLREGARGNQEAMADMALRAAKTFASRVESPDESAAMHL